MKSFFFLILAALVLVACQSTPQDKTPTENPEMAQWVNYPGQGKKIVLISGDEEYRSEEALPQLGKILSQHHGFDCTVLFAQDPDSPGVVKPKYLHNIPGLEALCDADLMIIATRFRELPDDQMQEIDDYLMSGRPVIGMRTATHAFNIKDSTSAWKHYSNGYKGDKTEWKGGFGRLVLGEKWISHHGHHKHQSTVGLIAEKDHPIASGLADGDIWGPTDVYGVRLPLPGDAQPIVLGQVTNREGEYKEEDLFFGMQPSDREASTVNTAKPEAGNPNDPMMPVAWTKSYQLPGGKQGKVFATTMGSSTDLLSDGMRRLLVNAAFWLLDLEVPPAANVALVGDYQPTQYSFMSDEYWNEKQMKVSEAALR
jgi:hypothetical protein